MSKRETLRERTIKLAKELKCSDDFITYLQKVRYNELSRRMAGLVYVRTFEPMNSDTVTEQGY